MIRDESNCRFVIFARECCNSRSAVLLIVERTFPISLAACFLVVRREGVAFEKDVTRSSF